MSTERQSKKFKEAGDQGRATVYALLKQAHDSAVKVEVIGEAKDDDEDEDKDDDDGWDADGWDDDEDEGEDDIEIAGEGEDEDA